ncbi:MAG: hypothetical protein IH936_09340 [Acidobacteria bacterium]|nr:hypothetical protein [Acidobacteriota bacterium]
MPDALDARNGVRQSDLYQLYAYAQRYECPDNVLLFPAKPGVTGKCYSVDKDPAGKRVRVEVVEMNRDLRQA